MSYSGLYNCLIIDWFKQSPEVRTLMKNWCIGRWVNNTMIEYYSDVIYKENDSPDGDLNRWYNVHHDDGESFEDFIVRENFELDLFIIEYMKEHGYNHKLIDKIIFNISW